MNQGDEMTWTAAPALRDGDPRHGTCNGYRNLGCRCDECRRANTLYCRRAYDRRRRQGLPPDDPRHGIPSSYGNYGCRCRPCTDAWTVDCKKRPSYQAKRGAAK